MRSGVNGDTFPTRSRKSSTADTQESRTPLPQPGHGMQTTYFLADERTMEAATTGSVSASSMSQTGSGYSVRSLEDTITEERLGLGGENADETEQTDNRERILDGGTGTSSHTSNTNDHVSDGRATEPSTSKAGTESGSPVHRTRGNHPAARFLMPLLFSSRAPEPSLPSSPRSISSKSLRSLKPEDSDSTGDDAASQAIISSEDEEEVEVATEVQDSAPQLIMPSIKMPSRRPFTARGKEMGRLKVLIVGESGIGKTSLIKSIVQACEDIVHVDPISSQPPVSPKPDSKRTATSFSINPSTRHITEVFASTKPYPMWWSELDDSRVLRRRKSFGDCILERNICFVDTPGYPVDGGPSGIGDIIVNYVETQLRRVTSRGDLTDGDLMNFLTGNGGPQVDVVFFLIPARKLTAPDLDLLRRLCCLANIIPLISKVDLLSPEQTESLKTSILNTFRDNDLQPFLFGKSIDELAKRNNPSPPFAISTTTASDAENMDASLLMSSEYVQPLVPSELVELIERVFERDSVAWLRHSAAKKCILWRQRQTSPALATAPLSHSPSSLGSSAYAGVGEGSASSSDLSSSSPSPSWKMSAPPMGAASVHALARAADHRRYEERSAQAGLAKWATDLQRSLQNERERSEALACREKCVADGTLGSSRTTPRRAHPDTPDGHSSRAVVGKAWSEYDRGDPLGLMQLGEELRRRGWVVLQIVGGLSLMGGLALWMTRNWSRTGDEFTSRTWYC
ncbi:MAG: hypothetical protein M1816_006980 [Peltula sp. TS41687]|nr:MAG: hypothetical protein M1816_006980 [Peltula sp. TS41687]